MSPLEQESEVTQPAFPWTALSRLKSSIRGQVLTPEAADYDQVRSVWNGMIDRRPSLIVRCAAAADVVSAVRFAREHHALVAVRGGGHNVAGLGVCDDGVMIDLSLMRGIRVSRNESRARAEGGATWGDFDRETTAFDLTTTGGMISSTGIGGLTLGGGLGWQMARLGLASDNLQSVDLVTADGELITVDQTRSPDLFWALRGGGGNFGVVTSFEFAVHPTTPVVGGMILFPLSEAREVLRFYREFVTDAPDNLTANAALLTTPDGHDVAAIVVAYFGPVSQAETALAPLRKFKTPMADLVGEMSYLQLQTLIDPATPKGLRRYWKSGYFPAIPDELIELLVTHAENKTSPLSMILLLHMHGKAAAAAPDATAFGARAVQWDFDIIPQWVAPSEDARHIGWAKEFFARTERFARGVYTNHLDVDDGPPRVRAAYGQNFDRLVSVKRKYDPDNFFRVNHNISPTVERDLPRSSGA